MRHVETFFPLFEEMTELATEAQTLLEGERGMEHFKEELSQLIDDFQFFLEPTEINPFQDGKMEQSVHDLKTVFENIIDFFSNTFQTLNENQQAIQAYSQRALDHVFEA